jgi:hypothetical protein
MTTKRLSPERAEPEWGSRPTMEGKASVRKCSLG